MQVGTPRRADQASTATPDASARRPYLNLPEQLHAFFMEKSSAG
jgi:hypothetical protein